MAMPVFPTKGNLINTKKSLSLAKLGYDLMDRKRNILIREMVSLVDQAKSIRGEIEDTYAKAYRALQAANITMGVIDVEHGVHITYRSVMGVEIPKVTLESTLPSRAYGFMDTNSQFDLAYASFQRAKELTIVLAEVENSVCRLANEIKKTQRRANALHNIIIPQFESTIKMITDSLEEKEREEFSRLKVIKRQKAGR